MHRLYNIALRLSDCRDVLLWFKVSNDRICGCRDSMDWTADDYGHMRMERAKRKRNAWTKNKIEIQNLHASKIRDELP